MSVLTAAATKNATRTQNGPQALNTLSLKPVPLLVLGPWTPHPDSGDWRGAGVYSFAQGRSLQCHSGAFELQGWLGCPQVFGFAA